MLIVAQIMRVGTRYIHGTCALFRAVARWTSRVAVIMLLAGIVRAVFGDGTPCRERGFRHRAVRPASSSRRYHKGAVNWSHKIGSFLYRGCHSVTVRPDVPNRTALLRSVAPVFPLGVHPSRKRAPSRRRHHNHPSASTRRFAPPPPPLLLSPFNPTSTLSPTQT